MGVCSFRMGCLTLAAPGVMVGTEKLCHPCAPCHRSDLSQLGRLQARKHADMATHLRCKLLLCGRAHVPAAACMHRCEIQESCGGCVCADAGGGVGGAVGRGQDIYSEAGGALLSAGRGRRTAGRPRSGRLRPPLAQAQGRPRSPGAPLTPCAPRSLMVCV